MMILSSIVALDAKIVYMSVPLCSEHKSLQNSSAKSVYTRGKVNHIATKFSLSKSTLLCSCYIWSKKKLSEIHNAIQSSVLITFNHTKLVALLLMFYTWCWSKDSGLVDKSHIL